MTGADAFVRLKGEALPRNGVFVDSVPRAVLSEALRAEPSTSLNFYGLNFGAQEEDPEVGDLLVIVRPRPDQPSLNGHWTTISGGRLSATGLPTPDYGTVSKSKLHWGVGTAAMALDPDSARSSTLEGLAPAYHEEVCLITAVNQETGAASIQRGVFDTVPAPVPAGAWVYHLKGRPPVPRQTAPSRLRSIGPRTRRARRSPRPSSMISSRLHGKRCPRGRGT